MSLRSSREAHLVGNVMRHDYGGQRVVRTWNTVVAVMPRLRDTAERLLEAHRRLHGG